MNKLSHIAELALIRSIYDLLKDKLKPGRLKGKYEALQKEVDKTLAGRHIDKDAELPVIGKALEKFADATKWNNKELSVGTILSFVLAMVEESDNKSSDKITSILNEIVEYHEQTKQFSALCYSAGAIASEKWTNIKKEVFV